MAYLLDTNILIALSKQRPGPAERLNHISAHQVLLSSVVVAEIEYGIAKSSRQDHNRRVFDGLLQEFSIVAFDAAAARQYGILRANLERQGQLIGPNDLMIAAHALALDGVLVTDNLREFARVPGLRLENWLEAQA